jgi:hypothetical protein
MRIELPHGAVQPVGESGPRASAVTVRQTIRPVTDETQNGTWHTLAALDHRPMRNQAQKPSSGTARLRTAVRPHWSLQRWTPVPVRPPDAAHDDARSRRRPVSRVPPPAAAPADPLASSGSNGWVGTNPHQRDLRWSSRTATSVESPGPRSRWISDPRSNSSSQIGEIPPRSRFEIRRSSSQIGEIPRRSVVEREHARARDDALRPVACERVAVGKVEHPLALMNEAIRAPQRALQRARQRSIKRAIGSRRNTSRRGARTSLRPEAHSPS